tara:strand:- start:872 stop:1444 length:573 start_codon:yes stop_codon:yes gene_type:complete
MKTHNKNLSWGDDVMSTSTEPISRGIALWIKGGTVTGHSEVSKARDDITKTTRVWLDALSNEGIPIGAYGNKSNIRPGQWDVEGWTQFLSPRDYIIKVENMNFDATRTMGWVAHGCFPGNFKNPSILPTFHVQENVVGDPFFNSTFFPPKISGLFRNVNINKLSDTAFSAFEDGDCFAAGVQIWYGVKYS